MSNKNDIIEALKKDDLKEFINLVGRTRNVGEANITISIQNYDVSNNGQHNETQGEQIPSDGLTLLHVAAFYGALDCFVYLQKTKNVNIRAPSSHSFIPLHYACWSGSTEVALYILTQDPSEAALPVQGGTSIQLLYCAVMGGDSEVLQVLFNNGASLSHTFNDKKKLVNKAIGLHKIDILRILYDNLSDSKDLLSPCAQAINDHNLEAFQMLYQGKKDILFKTSSGATDSLVHLICCSDRDHKFKPMLMKILDDADDLDLEPPGVVGEGLVHFACNYLDLDVARKLSNMPSFKVNRLDPNGKSGPFRLIVRNKDKGVVDMLQLLIDKNFQIDGIGQNCPSLLESFVLGINKNYEAIDCLLKNGASTDIKCTRPNAKNQTLYEYVMGPSCSDKKLKELFKPYKKRPK